jgi:signal transduction histidine kinase
MVVVAGGLGWVVAGRILRPIDAITATAQRLSAENLHERLALQRPDDELKRLADTFDAMLDRLDAAFEGQRRFVAAASHELRTPLTIMRTEIDVALRRPDTTNDKFRAMSEVVRSTITRADRLVTSLLALATTQHPREVSETLDLAQSVQQALKHHQPRFDARRIAVDTDLQPALLVGDPGLIDRVAENLIDNAATHTPDGGAVHVHTAHDNDDAVIDIANTGALIPPEELARLFEPFHRGSRANGNTTGIGLTIVRSVVHAHNGTVTAETLSGGGLRVVAHLPTHRHADDHADLASVTVTDTGLSPTEPRTANEE